MLVLAVLIAAGGRSAGPVAVPYRREMLLAARRMAAAIDVVREARQARGLALDPQADPNRTGLIGVEFSAFTTTVGDLAAKRTATNPNMAAGLVRWLAETGVRRGSVVAVGASGSFPGLVIATSAAALALGAEPVVISSVAASSWGANLPEFTWLDMEAALAAAGLVSRSIAASPGGEADVGAGLAPDARRDLERAVARAGVPAVAGDTLKARVEARITLYERAAAGRPIAVFVNVGGAAANIGTCLEILQVAPGVHRRLPACRGEPGVLWRMSGRGVPVVHLLHVDGIARAFGLPRDPVPLPAPGRGGPFTRPSRAAAAGLLGLLAAGLAGILAWHRRVTAQSPPQAHRVAP
jgi:poly-gamma-glutamate system protein